MRHASTDSHAEIFREFDAEAEARLTDLGIEARFDAGTVVFQEHEPAGQFYCIIEGSVALEQPALGRPVRIQTLHVGDFFGWSALLGSGTRHFAARALTPVTAMTFEGALLRKSCEEYPRFGYELMKWLLKLMTERLDAARSQVAGIQDGRGCELGSMSGPYKDAS